MSGASNFNFDNYVNKIEEKRVNLSEGKFNCIPFTDKFPKLSTVLPGIIKGIQYKVTASSGVGKTQLAKYLFVRTPYDFIKAHPKAGLKLKVLYFALEESKEEFINTMIVAWLADTYGIEIDVLKLNSMLEPLEDGIVEKIREGREYFDDLFSMVDVVDSVSNPYGLYKYCRDYSNANGTHYWTQLEAVSDAERKFITHDQYEKSSKEGWKYSHYVPKDEHEYVIVITDHISLLSPEKGEILHQTMGNWSANYCRKQLTKHWGYVVVNVQQQNAESESVEHFKANKLEPSLNNLANNKETYRDDLVILGLFAPARYELDKYMGYDIKRFKDNFRSLIILKNRIGKPNVKLALYYDGAVNRFKELPYPEEKDRLEKVYQVLERKK
jgi:replicative DNA helicase